MAEKIVEVDGKRYMKVQKGKYFNKKKNRKMKRHHPVRWILISAFCLLIVAPVGFIFGAFYDPQTKEVNDTTEKFTESFTNVLAKGLVGIGESSKLTIELDNDFLDSALVIAQENLLSDPTINQFIKKLYCNIDGNNYDFIIEAQLSFFKTRIHLQTVMNYDESSETYIFKINDIVLGRLPLGGLAKQILPQFISEDQIKTAINSIFKNCNFSLSDMQITYKKADLKADLGNILDSIDLDILGSPLSSVLLSLYNSIDSSATFTDKITINMDFSKCRESKVEVRNPVGQDFKNNINTYSAEITQLLNDKLLTTDESGTIFKFFLTGYSDDSKSIFESKSDLKKVCEEYLNKLHGTTGVTVESYKGDPEYLKKKKEQSEVTVEGLPESMTLEKFKEGVHIAKIKESVLSDFMRGTGMMGYTFAMPLQINDKYVFNFVTFDDFSVNIEEGSINILGDLNLNGLCMPLTIECATSFPVEPITNRKMYITPSNTYIANIVLPSDVQSTLLDYIAQGFTSGELFSFENKQFVLDFSKIELSGTSQIEQAFNNILKAINFEFLGTQINASDVTFVVTAKYDDDYKGYLDFYTKYNVE